MANGGIAGSQIARAASAGLQGVHAFEAGHFPQLGALVLRRRPGGDPARAGPFRRHRRGGSWTAPVPIPCSRPCSARPPEPSAASASRRAGKARESVTALVAGASEVLWQAGTRNCHIGWTTRESFYRRAGYQPWRRYAMFSSPRNHVPGSFPRGLITAGCQGPPPGIAARTDCHGRAA